MGPMLRQIQPFSTVATHMLSVSMVLTVPTPTIHTPIPAAAMLPAQLFHVLTTMSSRGKPRLRLTPTQPTLSAPTLLNTDSQGPFTETVWSTPLTTASAPTTWVNRSHAKYQVVD